MIHKNREKQSSGSSNYRLENMCSLENTKASYQRWSGSYYSVPNQSSWLQTTLAELDEKAKAILALVEEEGDSFAQRAEMYYKRRPQLIKMVEELHRSYICLAEQHDQLRSQATLLTASGSSSSSSNSFRQVRELSKRFTGSSNSGDSHPGYITEEDPNKEMIRRGHKVGNNVNGIEVGESKDGEHIMFSLENEEMLSHVRFFEVSKLMEESLRQLNELIKRNDEKREAIKELYSEMDKVVDENRRLQNCVTSFSNKLTVKQNRSPMLKLKHLILKKLLGRR